MDIRHLRYFIATVESGSLSQAARRLHIVQPALSQRMSALESELGTPLLVRGTQGVAVTPAGQELYARALTIVKQLDAAQDAVRQHAQGVAGTVHIGLLRTAAGLVAPALFAALRRDFPALVTQMRVGYSADLAAQLRAGKLDIAMQVRAGDAKDRREPVLYSERLCVVGPPGLVPDVPTMGLRGLAGMPLLLSSMQPNFSTILEAAADAGVTLSVVGGIEHAAAVLDICESGAAATVLPESAAAADIRGRQLRAVVLDEQRLRRDVVLVTNSDVPSTGAVLTAEAVLRQLLRDMAGGMSALAGAGQQAR